MNEVVVFVVLDDGFGFGVVVNVVDLVVVFVRIVVASRMKSCPLGNANSYGFRLA